MNLSQTESIAAEGQKIFVVGVVRIIWLWRSDLNYFRRMRWPSNISSISSNVFIFIHFIHRHPLSDRQQKVVNEKDGFPKKLFVMHNMK